MAPQIAIPVFDDSPDIYMRMAHVAKASAQKHNPDWDVNIWSMPRPPLSSSHEFDALWLQKIEAWTQVVEESPKGSQLLVLDADTVTCESLDSLWGHKADVFVTEREGQMPINCGVMAFRISRKVVGWMQAWGRLARGIADSGVVPYWSAGVDQIAILPMLLRGTQSHYHIRIHRLPCRVWNCEQTYWHTLGPQTKILHVKSDARKAIVTGKVPGYLKAVVSKWKEYE